MPQLFCSSPWKQEQGRVFFFLKGPCIAFAGPFHRRSGEECMTLKLSPWQQPYRALMEWFGARMKESGFLASISKAHDAILGKCLNGCNPAFTIPSLYEVVRASTSTQRYPLVSPSCVQHPSLTNSGGSWILSSAHGLLGTNFSSRGAGVSIFQAGPCLIQS